MIEMNHVVKRFGKKEILKDINCKMGYGVYGLLGANGAGKTTLMRCMTNLYSVTSGDIKINGVSSTKRKKVKIGYLPQAFGLFKELTVYDSMQYFCNLKGIPRKKRNAEIERCLKAVNMENEKKNVGAKLSGGMLRRIGVAQALLNNPDLILFDEPTAGLDPEERMRFKNIISDVGQKETVIISTHIVEDVEACCDKVIVMNQGKVICMKTCEELAEMAEGKVVECKKGEEGKIPCNYLIEKQYTKNGVIYDRVLLEEAAAGFERLTSTVEDGYMAVIKGFCSCTEVL